MFSKRSSIIILLVIIIVVVVYYTTKKPHISSSVEKDNTIAIAVLGEPATLDPSLMTGTWEAKIAADLFTGLTQRDSKGKIIPAIATSWKVSNGGKKYIFKLRKDAKWSDGTALTARDFVFSYERVLNPKTIASYASLFYVIKNGEKYYNGKIAFNKVGVKALNDYTLELDLEHPAVYLTELLAHQAFAPLPQHVVEKLGKDWSKPENFVSDGAYKLVEWKPKAYIKATRNPYYYDNKDTSIDNVIYYTQEERSAVVKRFRSGEIDIVTEFDSDQYEWLMKNMKKNVVVAPYIGLDYFVFNTTKDKFKDIRVRKALNMAVDREFITDKVLKSGEKPAYSFVVPGVGGYSPYYVAWKNTPIEKRKAEAIKLLKAAGYTDSKPLEVEISYNTSEDHKKIAVAVASMWKDIGVKTTLINQDVAVHYAKLTDGDFEIGRNGWIADYVDPSAFLFTQTSYAVYNYTKFINKAFDKYFEKAQESSSKVAQMKDYYNAEKELMDSQVLIPIFYNVNHILVSDRVQNWYPNYVNINQTRYLKFGSKE